jgi:hypothetical protein
MSQEPTNAPTAGAPAALNGWKEIAAHFGRAVRTVQRWEADLGLPVHRMPGGAKGEIVYAYLAEVEGWRKQREQEILANGNGDGANGGVAGTSNGVELVPATHRTGAEPQAQPAGARGKRRSGRVLLPAGLLALVALIVLGVSWSGGGVPTSWKVEGNALTVLDEAGRPLWRKAFDALLIHVYETDTVSAGGVAIDDLDADGRKEVLFAELRGAGTEQAFHCYESDGRERFSYLPTYARRFGDVVYRGPWGPYRLFVTRDGGTTTRIRTVWIHMNEFATVLDTLDPRGRSTDQFWNDGYIETVAEARLNGKPVLLVGGTNNEFKTAFMAVLDAEHASGTAPAIDTKYRCTDCPARAPLRYFLFPRMELARELDSAASTREIKVDSAGNAIAIVDHACVSIGNDTSATHATVFYTFDSSLNLRSAEVGRDYMQLHHRFEREGRLHHAYGAADEQGLLPVSAWNGSAFAPTAPPVQTPTTGERR